MTYQSLETLPNDTSNHLYQEDQLDAVIIKGPLSLEVSLALYQLVNKEHD